MGLWEKVRCDLTRIWQSSPKTNVSKTGPEGENSSLSRHSLQGHQTSHLPSSSIRSDSLDELEKPETCWAAHPSCLGTAIIYSYASCILMGATFFTGVLAESTPLNTLGNTASAIPMAIYNFYFVVLSSLTAELAVPRNRHWLQRSYQFLLIGFFLTHWCYTNLFILHSNKYFQFLPPIGLYILGCLVHRAIGLKKKCLVKP